VFDAKNKIQQLKDGLALTEQHLSFSQFGDDLFW